ncbi:hypothetical protein G9A89_017573 [Geosiphon pyriformis]|nr:hypothetical protein G9A89_017573 [Geosiphon pyriformis]
MLALKTIPELSITITGKHINYTQTKIVANLAPNSQNYYPYKKNTRSYSGIHLPELLKLALRENLIFTPISILPNATIQQKLQLCLNEKNHNYTPIYRYFYIGKTLYKQKWELTAANLTKEAIQKQLHNKFTTTAGPINSHYKLRAALRLYNLFHICENVLQNPILQSLKIQYIGKLTELKFQQFSDQISSIILDYYLEITDSTWTLTELSLEEKTLTTVLVSSEKKAHIYEKHCNQRKTNSVPYNQRTQQNYAEDASSIIESTKRYHFPYPPSLPVTFGAPYLEIPARTAYAESDFCNYINAKIDCLLGRVTDTGRLGEQIYQSLLGYSTAMTTRAIAETLHIINTDIKYYEYENESNNPVTAQAKSIVNKKPRVLSPTTSSYYQTLQSRIVFNPPLEIHWTKSLGEYRLLFENLTPAAGQTERNPSTWEQPPAQNLAESASLLTEKTAILQSIGSSDKGKQPALASREHSNMWTPIPLNITSNTPPINQIMAYRNITKLEKFSGEEDNTYSWIADTEKAVTANGWNDNCTVQALPFFLIRTTNLWYQSLAEKPTSFTEFKLTFLQYFCDPNTLIRLQNQFSIIKQKDHEAVTTYLRRFNQILCQILAIERDYYTAVQVLNQFIKRLQRPHHPTSLQDAITLACNFESAEQEMNHTQAVNLAINRTSDIDAKITQLSEKLTQKIKRFLAETTRTYQPPQRRENNNNSRYPQQQNRQQQQQPWRSDPHNCYYCQKPGHIAYDCRRKIMNQNQGNPYQQPKYQQNMVLQYFISQNQPPLYAQQVQTNSELSRPIPHGLAQSQPTPTEYPNQASYLGLMEDQSFNKSTPMEEGDIEQISQPSKQTKSNIPPATITEDTTLATIFLFDIDNLNTHSLFSGAAINQDKPIMALYTNARVREIDIKLILDSRSAVDCAATAQIITVDGNTKTPIREIDNFLFEINGIQIPTKKTTGCQKPMLLSTETSKNFNSFPATCRHFKNQRIEEPLIEFEDTSMSPTIKTYQVSWADDYQTELPPLPTWEKKRKGRAEEKLQSSSLGYVTSDQRNLFYQPPRLICVDCKKKLSTMGACIRDNKEWPTAIKYYCRPCKWDHTPCLTCGKDKAYTWKQALNRLDGYSHNNHKIWRMASTKAEDATPKEI